MSSVDVSFSRNLAVNDEYAPIFFDNGTMKRLNLNCLYAMTALSFSRVFRGTVLKSVANPLTTSTLTARLGGVVPLP